MSTPIRIVVATANPDKLVEIDEILHETIDAPIELVARPTEIPDVEETGATLEENARLKAAAICLATGEISVADDTGLFVVALGGAPGVYSARYAGPDATYDDNVSKLLAALDGVDDRRASFSTVAVAVFPDGSELVAHGEVQGAISLQRRGEGGFGYDPIFVPDSKGGRSFAELSRAEKHEISHRGRAFRALGLALENALGRDRSVDNGTV